MSKAYNFMRFPGDSVSALQDKAADVNAENSVKLREAAEKGDTDAVTLLLDRGADIHAKNDRALQWAARNGHTEMVDLLLDRGADAEAAIATLRSKNKREAAAFIHGKTLNTGRSFSDMRRLLTVV